MARVRHKRGGVFPSVLSFLPTYLFTQNSLPGAGVPKGTILCLGRVLDAHDEQDDAEGGRRDWEEDPLGFDTNPGLLRAMCMAFE